jgi:ornithine--oxo-acid transaminase
MRQSMKLINESDVWGARIANPLPVVLEEGEGVWVTDIEGKKYLDMLSAFSVLNQGHRHPRIIQALVAQAQKLTITSRSFRNDQTGIFFRKICEMTGFEKVLPMNTGAEAVETAIKAVRKWALTVKGIPENQAEIIVCANNFAGRTITLISFSTVQQYRHGFGPFTPGFSIVPFGDASSLEEAITPNTAAVLLEPIQGEGGIIIPPDGYLSQIRNITKKHQILMVLDEIQTGFGRTGKLFAYQYEDIKPDVLIVGKALGGGVYPVSAILADDAVMSVFAPGDHGSTFAGNPLAAAVAVAAMEVVEEENLPERAAEMGDYFLQGLLEINSPYIREIRGKGLFIGIEIRPECGYARFFCEKLLHLGVLCKDTHQQVIRFAPPLIITREELDWALERIRQVLTEPLYNDCQ